jgi:hypothetical protein
LTGRPGHGRAHVARLLSETRPSPTRRPKPDPINKTRSSPGVSRADLYKVNRLRVFEPFAADDDFWVSTRASMAVLPALIATGVAVLLAGPVGYAVCAVPVGLTVLAALRGRRSSRRTRPSFPDRIAWRDAERQAVGAVLIGARRPRRPAAR